MQCGSCHRPLRDNAVVCRSCGWQKSEPAAPAAATIAAQAPPESPIERVSEPATAKVETPRASEKLDSAPSEEKSVNEASTTFSAIVATLSLVAVVGICAAIFLMNRKASDDEKVKAAQVAQAQNEKNERIQAEALRQAEKSRQQYIAQKQREASEQRRVEALQATTPLSNGSSNLASVPDVQIGDTWTYQTIEPETGKKLAQFTYDVIGVSGTEIEVRSSSSTDFINGRPFRLTREWNTITFPQPNGAYREYSKPLQAFSFPLSTGKRWSSDTVATNTVTKNQVAIKISGLVEYSEEIVTPAGRFFTYKVVVEQLTEPIAQKVSPAKVTEVYWYSPEARRNVKLDRSSTSLESGKTERFVTELLSYNRR